MAIGDDRKWAEARWDLLPATATAEQVREATEAAATESDRYVVHPQTPARRLPAGGSQLVEGTLLDHMRSPLSRSVLIGVG